MTKQCFFCGMILSRNQDKEDKVPCWFQKYFAIEKIPIDLDFITHDGTIRPTKKFSSCGDLSGTICRKKCNNGWMSDLEDSASPLLKCLFEKQLILEFLSSPEKETLCLWLVKTAYVLLSATEFSGQIPVSHASHLMDFGTIPINVQVAGIQVESSEKVSRYAILQWQTFPPLQSNDDDERVCKESYKIGLHFGNHFFLVAHFPLAGWRLALDHRYYFPLSSDEEKFVWITAVLPELKIANNPKDGLIAYVNSAMALMGLLILEKLLLQCRCSFHV